MAEAHHMTVKDLKSIIEDLPNDMSVIFATFDDEDVDHVKKFYHVKTAGIVTSDYAEEPVLVLNTSHHYKDISEQLLYSGKNHVHCDKVLY